MPEYTGYKGAVYVTSSPSVALTSFALNNPSLDGVTWTTPSAQYAKRYWDKTTAFTVQQRFDDVQTVTVTGGPTGGTFTLVWSANTTTTIAYNASAATVQSALQALPGVGSGQVSVTGVAGGPWAVEWTGTLGYAAQSAITLGTNSLTGGSSPSVSIAHTQTGQTWTTLSSGYTIQYVGGIVVLTSALLIGTPGVQILSGAYFPYSLVADAHQWEMTWDVDIVDVTAFNLSGWKAQLPLMHGATVKYSRYWADSTYLGMLGNLMVVVCFIDNTSGPNTGMRFEGYAYLKQDPVKSDIKQVLTEDLDFMVDGQWYYVAN